MAASGIEGLARRKRPAHVHAHHLHEMRNALPARHEVAGADLLNPGELLATCRHQGAGSGWRGCAGRWRGWRRRERANCSAYIVLRHCASGAVTGDAPEVDPMLGGQPPGTGRRERAACGRSARGSGCSGRTRRGGR